MAYAHTTWGALKTELITRLGGGAFWTNTATYSEVGGYLREAMRLYAALSLRWKKRISFNLTSGDYWYDLSSNIGFKTATDRDLAVEIMYHLLEAPDTAGWTWTGTEQFTLAELQTAIQDRRDQFLLETGIVLTKRDQGVTANATGRFELTDPAIAVRRLTWKTLAGVRSHVPRDDEFQAHALSLAWQSAAAVPLQYSEAITPPITLQLIPRPSADGTLELVVVDPGDAVDLSTGVVVGIPDNLAWAIKWGAVADLLAKDGQARDIARAEVAEARYAMGVQAAMVNPSVAVCYVNGAHVPVVSVHDLDTLKKGWESTAPAQPQMVAMMGHNLAAFWPTPNSDYAVEMDVTAEAPIPASDGTNIQIGQEELGAILDMAFHLANFKMGLAESQATARASETLYELAAGHNERVRGFTTTPEPLHDRSQRERKRRRYRDQGANPEMLPSVTDNA